jgi:hypothetical protein
MAKGRIRSRMELREQYEAAEARERADREGQPEDEADDEVEESDEEAVEESEGGEGDEEAAPVKKKKKPAAVKEPSKRKKTTKQVPKRVVWVVYDNSYKKVKTYPYNQKKEAEDEAERLRQDKKTTYFVQPFKEDITPA